MLERKKGGKTQLFIIDPFFWSDLLFYLTRLPCETFPLAVFQIAAYLLTDYKLEFSTLKLKSA